MQLKQILGLRGLAIISVLFFHLNLDFFKGGFVGVDIFFVISGFLITKILIEDKKKNKIINIKRFFFRRFSRLAPTYILTLIITVILGILLYSYNDYQNLIKSFLSSATGISNIFFWITTSYWDYKAKYDPFLHTWSLSVEFQFYFFIVLIFLFSSLIKFFRNPFFIGILFCFFSSLIIFYIYRFSINSIFFLLPFRLFEFLSGSIIYFIRLKKRIDKFDIYFLFFGLLGIFFSVYNFNQSTMAYPSILIPVISSCLILFCSKQMKFNQLLDNNFLNFFGKISYTLYLIHWPIICFYRYYSNLFNLNNLDQIILTLLIIIFSSLIYFYYEKPLNLNLNKKYDIGIKIFSKKTYFASFSFILLFCIFNISKINTNNVDEKLNEDYFGVEKKVELNSINEFIILGDSHALHLLPGIKKFSNSENFSYKYFERKIDNNLNSIFYLNILEKIKENISEDKINTLIISYRWDNLKTISRLAYTWNPNIKADEIAKLFILKLNELLNELDINFEKIVIIGSFPMPTQFMGTKNCLERPKYFGEISCEFSKINKNSKIEMRKKINLSFKKQLNKKLNFVDPFNYFCEKIKCKNIINDNIIYIDDNHLSKEGSVYFIKNIINKLVLN